MRYNMLMEFPKNPTKRQRRQQISVSAVITGMQDVCLEPSPDRLEQILHTAYDLPYPQLGLAALTLVDVNKFTGASGTA